MMVMVWVVWETHVFHLVNAAALIASLIWTCFGDLQPSVSCHHWPGDSKARKLTTSHLTTWESAGHPVHPNCSSSPADRTVIGSSSVPEIS